MRKSLRFIAFFSALVLLFCVNFTPVASYNDAKYDNYINLGQKGAENNYAIPHLFRQDAPYGYMDSYPMIIKNSVEYVPLSLFILYPYVEVSYSNKNENFFLENNNNQNYVSFDVANGLASTYDGDLLKMNTYVFNKIRYVPARTVCIMLGFTYEYYDDPVKGIYSFRISDGRSKKTLEDLLQPYLPKQEEKVELPPPEPEIVVEEDPIKKIAKRNVALCFKGFGTTNKEDLLKTLSAYRIKAAFALEKEDIVNNPSLVRSALVNRHMLYVTSKAQGETPELYAKSFVDGLESANDALKFVIKRKTRMCLLPEDIPDDVKMDNDFLKVVYDAGYIVFDPNTHTSDSSTYNGSAYTVSRQIKNAITEKYDKTKEANISVVIYAKQNSTYTVADVASFVNNYEQFGFVAADEVFLYNS